MSAMTDKAFDLIPTLKAALKSLDEAWDNREQADEDEGGGEALRLASENVDLRTDDVLVILSQIEKSLGA